MVFNETMSDCENDTICGREIVGVEGYDYDDDHSDGHHHDHHGHHRDAFRPYIHQE